jgi:hypothetical protein
MCGKSLFFLFTVTRSPFISRSGYGIVDYPDLDLLKTSIGIEEIAENQEIISC